jgi:hypothetical protein
MTDFVVRLEGVELPKDVQAELAGEIQGLVMRRVAKISTGGDLNARVGLRREWLGLWLRPEIFDKKMNLKVEQTTSR